MERCTFQGEVPRFTSLCAETRHCAFRVVNSSGQARLSSNMRRLVESDKKRQSTVCSCALPGTERGVLRSAGFSQAHHVFFCSATRHCVVSTRHFALVRSSESATLLICALDRKLLCETKNEMTDERTAEVCIADGIIAKNRSTFFDPSMRQILLLLGSEAKTGGASGQFYAEHLIQALVRACYYALRGPKDRDKKAPLTVCRPGFFAGCWTESSRTLSLISISQVSW